MPLLSPPLDVPTFAARCLYVRNDARDPRSERWNCGRERYPVILPKFRLPLKFMDLLHAANLRHGTDGFTSPPKEGVLRIFFVLKNPTASAGFEPTNLGTIGQHATPRPPKPISTYFAVIRLYYPLHPLLILPEKYFSPYVLLTHATRILLQHPTGTYMAYQYFVEFFNVKIRPMHFIRQHHSIHTITVLHVSVLKGSSSGSTDTFCKQGEQNTCPDVNIWKSKHIYV